MPSLVCPHCGCTLGLFIARDGFPYAYCPHCGHAWDDEGASIDD